MKEQKIVRKFDEMVDLVRKREYAYLYRPEYVEDLGKGPRMCACQGAPASSGADMIIGDNGFIEKIEKATEDWFIHLSK